MYMYMHTQAEEGSYVLALMYLVNLTEGGEANLTEVVYILSSIVNDFENQIVEPVISEVCGSM